MADKNQTQPSMFREMPTNELAMLYRLSTRHHRHWLRDPERVAEESAKELRRRGVDIKKGLLV